MKKPLTPGQKTWLFRILAYLSSAGVPVATCAILFPPELQETHLSIGASLIVTLIISVCVFRKKLAELFENFTIIMTYAIILVICIACNQFISEMITVCIVGLAANLGALPLFKLADSNAELAKAIKEAKLKAEAEATPTEATQTEV